MSVGQMECSIRSTRKGIRVPPEHGKFRAMYSGSVLGASQFRLGLRAGQGNFSSDLSRKMEVVLVGKMVEHVVSESSFSDSLRPPVFLVTPSLSFCLVSHVSHLPCLPIGSLFVYEQPREDHPSNSYRTIMSKLCVKTLLQVEGGCRLRKESDSSFSYSDSKTPVCGCM